MQLALHLRTLSKAVLYVLQVTNSTASEVTVNSSSRRLLADAVSVTPTATSTLHTSAVAVEEHLLHVAQTQCAHTASNLTRHSRFCYSTRLQELICGAQMKKEML